MSDRLRTKVADCHWQAVPMLVVRVGMTVVVGQRENSVHVQSQANCQGAWFDIDQHHGRQIMWKWYVVTRDGSVCGPLTLANSIVLDGILLLDTFWVPS